MTRRTLVAGAIVFATLAAGSATASAAPKQRCPANDSGFVLGTVSYVVDTIYPQLVGYPGTIEDFTMVIEGDDVDGNGMLCMKTKTFDTPTSHWFGVPFFVVVDDNAAPQRA
jgi:hypothetical protein